MASVAVLFARKDSVYKEIRGCDVWDVERDARHYAGALPVVAHPPCRAWGNLRHFAKPRPDEKGLAIFAVAQVRRCGGVLEHPAHSTLWGVAGLPMPGAGRDEFGGYSVALYQSQFGHRAPKKTWLYVVGCSPEKLPPIPPNLGLPFMLVESMGANEREKTPLLFARWLVRVSRLAKK